MAKLDDGGSAFPRTYSAYGSHEGMSLRDWFAGQALGGWLGGYGPDDALPEFGYVAEQCYLYADAMIARRDKS